MDALRGGDGRESEIPDGVVRRALELVTDELLDAENPDDEIERAFDAALVGTFRALVAAFAAARGRSEPPFAAGPELEAERERLESLSPATEARLSSLAADVDWESLSTRHVGGAYERLLDREPTVTDDGVRLVDAPARRAAVGAYYTPEDVVEYAVSRALDGTEDARVLDPAMGSGHFLVRAIDRLAESRDEPAERARRYVAENRVFGVDVDPLAVELARSAVWLETGVWPADNLRVGDALAGDDPEVLRGGRFDAVVGNPPYVRSRHIPAETKSDLKERYDSATGSFDLYVPFLERMAELGDRVACVVPNKWTTARYGRTLRNRLLDRHRLVELLDVSAASVFADASVYPLVVTVETDAGPTETIRVRQADSPGGIRRATETTLSRSFVDELGDRVIPVGIDPAFVPVAERLLREHDDLGEHVSLTEGIHTGNVREKLVVDDPGPDREKLVCGGDVSRYGLEWDGEWVRFDPSLIGEDEYGGLRDRGVFECEKLLLRDISDRPAATYDADGFYALNTLYSVRPRPCSDLPLRYLLAVVNSTAAACWFRQVYGGTHVSGGYLRFKPMFAERLPVPAGADERDALAALANRMGELRRERDGVDVRLPEADGPRFGEVAEPLGDSILAETTSARDGLRLGSVSVEERGGKLVFAATARYRPGEDARETGGGEEGRGSGEEGSEGVDSWGFVETEPIPALTFDGDAAWRDLLRWYVPSAVEGDAFPDRATKTISLRDRLESLRVPTPDGAAEFLDARRRAAELDEKLARTDAAIDRLVYRAYGLSPGERETMERLVE
ncbi:Eco57I restriction-modification methylase domain-containing protein [Haladaptatus salinisoli]|uniref:Eco57I restriction-modification methylase domain-containing protein n=1 Tax=Haladaptatus salinisoli TaxID=2884876 RepID=UPI001D0AA797|nr:N-6 DNA methylase [Haladaptatus salinisoli]